MKNKIVGIVLCMLLVAPLIPLTQAGDDGTLKMSSPTAELRKAFIFGRYSNLTGQGGSITVVTANMFVIYQEPRSFAHFPRGTQVTFDMYSAYGHIFRKVGFLYLHVELVV
jgi:hypothetical protein